MHLRVWPSTVAVTVVVPLDTAVTVPSPEMVATEESEMLQVGLELVPLTLSCHLAPASLSVKSVRLRGQGGGGAAAGGWWNRRSCRSCW